jgi:hypothetical protein
MLAWTGGTHSIADFLQGFVVIGGGDRASWSSELLAPLDEYVRSLDAPANPAPAPAELIQRGQQLFAREGCAACHDGPRGSGRRLYGYDEVGTDSEMGRWMDAERDGTPCCGIDASQLDLTQRVKSPRLAGLWAMERFLHNGSVASLEELLCLDSARPTVTEPAYGDGGHLYGCGLGRDDKAALLAYLRR